MTAARGRTQSSGQIVAAAAAAIFALDLFVPLGIAVPMLYAIPILLSWMVPQGRSTVAMAGCCVVFTGLGIVLSPGEFTLAVAADRTLASMLELVIAGLVIAQKRLAEQCDADQALLQQQEERLRLFIEHAPVAFAMFDRDMRYLALSRRWRKDYGLEDQAPIGRVHYDVFPNLSDRWKAVHRRGLAGEIVQKGEDRFVREAGTEVWLRWEVRPWYVNDHQVGGILIVSEDITERKKAEQVLYLSERKFRTLAENVPALFGYIGVDRRYRFVNRRYEELFGRPREELIGKMVEDWLGQAGYEQVRPFLFRALEGESVSFEYHLDLPGGGVYYFSAQYVPDKDELGCVVGVYVLKSDVTALKATETLLRKREAELRELGTRLLLIQEEERRRISRDLHDDVMQRMGALALDLRRLACSISSHDAGMLQARLEACGGSAEQLTTDLQRLAHHLHPAILEFGRLDAAVREHVNEFALRTGLVVKLKCRKVLKDLSLEEAICLYRVLQEALQNVQKHADATAVVVRLLRTSRGLGLCVRDNGCGIEHLAGAVRGKGLGLISMEERTRMLGGTFRIRTRYGDGTEIHVWLPLKADRYDA